MKFIFIILLTIISAIVYGIVHDQITVRISIEYFLIGHPRIFHTESPTLLACGWGIIATWWVGLILGIPLAITARVGRWKKIEPKDLLKPIFVLLLIMGAVSILSGVIGYLTVSNGIFYLVEPYASRVPVDRHTAFLTAGWMHVGSYLAGFVGGIILIILTYKKRKVLSRAC